MKLKKKAKVPQVNDFWYDLAHGGYLDPYKLLEADDAAKVDKAVNVLKQFESLIEDNLDGE